MKKKKFIAFLMSIFVLQTVSVNVSADGEDYAVNESLKESTKKPRPPRSTEQHKSRKKASTFADNETELMKKLRQCYSVTRNNGTKWQDAFQFDRLPARKITGLASKIKEPFEPNAVVSAIINRDEINEINNGTSGQDAPQFCRLSVNKIKYLASKIKEPFASNAVVSAIINRDEINRINNDKKFREKKISNIECKVCKNNLDNYGFLFTSRGRLDECLCCNKCGTYLHIGQEMRSHSVLFNNLETHNTNDSYRPYGYLRLALQCER